MINTIIFDIRGTLVKAPDIFVVLAKKIDEKKWSFYAEILRKKFIHYT